MQYAASCIGAALGNLPCWARRSACAIGSAKAIAGRPYVPPDQAMAEADAKGQHIRRLLNRIAAGERPFVDTETPDT
jgi:hypothetical protein